MGERTRRAAMRAKRFTVTLDLAAYERLKAIADGQDPPLSLTYVAQYAIKLFLQRLEDPQRLIEFTDRTDRKADDG